MPVDYINNRRIQKRILVISLVIIAWGLYYLLSGQPSELITVKATDNAQLHKNPSLIVFVLVAVVMAFFSARNLIRKPNDNQTESTQTKAIK